jgi:Undecaprenyl-phosphate galactose phosphotransferase WbaP
MKKYLPALALLLTLLLASGLQALLTPALHSPYQVVSAPEGVRLTLLQRGYRDVRQCEQSLSAVTLAIQASCPSCVFTKNICLTKLDANQRKWLTDAPLESPASTTPSGIVLYESANTALALAACHEVERQSLAADKNIRSDCRPAGSVRPLHAPQQKILSDAMASRDVFLLAILALGLALAALVLTSHMARRRVVAAAGPQADKLSLLSRLPRFHWTQKLTLAGVDALVMLLAFAVDTFPAADDLSAWLRLDPNSLYIHCALVALVVGWFWVVLEHYGRRRTFFDELREIFHVVFIAFLLSSTTILLTGADMFQISPLLTWGLGFILLPVGRAVSRNLLNTLGLWKVGVAIIGTGNNAKETYSAITNDPCLGYTPCAYIAISSDARLPGSVVNASESTETWGADIDGVPVLFAKTTLLSTLNDLGDPIVVFALDPDLSQSTVARLVKEVSSNYFYFHLIPTLKDLPLLEANLSPFLGHELALLTFKNNLRKRTSFFIKRLIDLLLVIPGIFLFLPVVVLGAIAVFLTSRGNPFYAQKREGLDGKDVYVWKLRTMYPDAERLLLDFLNCNPDAKKEWEAFYKLSNDPRVLPWIGSLLRKTSIDELPQLWNVLTGDLSLVGPRPFPGYHLESFSEQFREFRRSVKPGITGLWQISARSDGNLAIQEHFDSYYIRNWSLWLDVYILWRTIDTVLTGRGAK